MNKKMKHKRKNKIILLLLTMILIIYLFIKYQNLITININTNDSSSKSNYSIIKQDENKNYTGVGQQKVKNEDGYFTTFTTVNNNKKTYKEYKQNGNSSWSKNTYWGDTMSQNGCGITVMSIILSGYNKDYNPEDLRKKYYPVLDYQQLSYELTHTFSIKNSDFYYDSIHLSSEHLISHLETNRPIIICVWNKPNANRWTTSSHYMALLATDGNDMVYISNPNGGINDSKSSGWYQINEIAPYIAKALYIESYE